jgi:hypothetical protein
MTLGAAHNSPRAFLIGFKTLARGINKRFAWEGVCSINEDARVETANVIPIFISYAFPVKWKKNLTFTRIRRAGSSFQVYNEKNKRAINKKIISF